MTKKKIAIAAVLVCILALGIAAVTWAADPAPTVIFDAKAKTFTFQNCTQYTYGDEDGDGTAEQYPDLFPAIKNAMPGDSFDQSIRVKVINAGKDVVKMYLRSEKPNKDYDELINDSGDEVKLTARFGEVGGAKSNILDLAKDFIRGKKDEAITSTDTNMVYLGAYTGSAREREIDVTFKLELAAGNEYAGRTATVDWVFIAEVIPYMPDPVGPTPGPDEDDERGTWNLELVSDHINYIIGRDDGLVHPEDTITRAEATTVFFRLMTDASRERYWTMSNPYYDVALTMWYNNAISTMTQAGIVEGCPGNMFEPDRPITRAEFVTIGSRILTAKTVVKNDFPDVHGHWAEPYIDNAVSLGIINGYPDGTFGPENPITRAEVMAICNRLLNRYPEEDSLLEGMIQWPDNMDKSRWFYLDVQEATNAHMYERKGTPQQYADPEYWTQLTPNIEWEKLERPDSAASNIYRSDRLARQER